MKPELIAVTVLAVLVVLCVLAGIASVLVAKSRGVFCRNKVGKACERLARRGGHIYLPNVTLPGPEGKPVHMDHVVAGTFGVLVFNCYDYRGDLYGNAQDQNWHLYQKEEKKSSFRNPLPKCQQAVPALRQVFAKEKVYNVTQIESYLVFSNGVKLNTPREAEGVSILRLKQVRPLLHREKYLMDNRVTPKQIAQAIKNHEIK